MQQQRVAVYMGFRNRNIYKDRKSICSRFPPSRFMYSENCFSCGIMTVNSQYITFNFIGQFSVNLEFLYFHLQIYCMVVYFFPKACPLKRSDMHTLRIWEWNLSVLCNPKIDIMVSSSVFRTFTSSVNFPFRALNFTRMTMCNQIVNNASQIFL